MVKSENIEFAISETIEVHPDYKPFLTQILLNNIQKNIHLKNFTSQNGARDGLQGLRNIDLVNYVIEQMIKIVNAATNYALNDPNMEMVADEEKYQSLLEVFPYFEVCKKILENCADTPNKIFYLLFNPVELISAVDCVMKTKFDSPRLQEYINNNNDLNVPLSETTTDTLLHDLRREYQILGSADNIQINPKAINNCLSDLITGRQIKCINNKYTLNGNLYASQDMGRKPNQEDSVVIMTHPHNPDFAFLAVADGMGGSEKGELASSYLLSELSKWFAVLPTSLFNQPYNLQELFNKKIAQINDEIYEMYNTDGKINAGTTFTGALVTADKTLISSVGDSRAYTVGNDGINIITRDESAVWPKNASAAQLGFDYIDDIRFNRLSNKITKCVGMKELNQIQCYQVPDNRYDKLILLTDGVTDLLETERINFITKNTPTDFIVNELVYEAIQKNAYRDQGEDEMHKGGLAAGKDNATAAMYARR